MDGNRRNHESKIFKKSLNYPLNQFNQNFVSKAKKGVSDVNWHAIINKIQNDVEDEENDLNLNDSYED